MTLDDFAASLKARPAAPLLSLTEMFADVTAHLDTEALIAAEVRHWLQDPKRPPPIVSEHTVRMRNFGRLALDLSVLHAKAVPAVISSHQDAIQRYLSPAHYILYDIVREDGLAVGLKQARAGQVAAGDILAVNGQAQVLVSFADQPVRFLSLSEFEHGGVLSRFDGATLQRVGGFAASPVSTSIQLAARFLGYYGEAACVGALEHLLDDDIGAIQWEAACAISRLDRSAGLQAFSRLASSHDPEVARAAAQTCQLAQA